MSSENPKKKILFFKIPYFKGKVNTLSLKKQKRINLTIMHFNIMYKNSIQFLMMSSGGIFQLEAERDFNLEKAEKSFLHTPLKWCI